MKGWAETSFDLSGLTSSICSGSRLMSSAQSSQPFKPNTNDQITKKSTIGAATIGQKHLLYT